MEDSKGNLAAFLLTEVKDDSKFLMAYYSLLEAGFDIHSANNDETSFLQALCLARGLSMPKIQGIIKTRPIFEEADYRRLDAKLMLHLKRHNNPTVKRVLASLRIYMAQERMQR